MCEAHLPRYGLSKQFHGFGVHLQQTAEVVQVSAFSSPRDSLVLGQDQITPGLLDSKAAVCPAFSDDLVSIDKRVKIVYCSLAGREDQCNSVFGGLIRLG